MLDGVIMQSVAGSNQTVCSRCEESVHRYATRCPYCQHDLSNQNQQPNQQQDLAASEKKNSDKIAHLPKAELKSQEIKPEPMFKMTQAPATPADSIIIPKEMQKVEEEEEVTSSSSDESYSANLIKVLFPLVSLLAGTFFFFFGLLLKLYSKNGVLTLSWNAVSWPYYVFPALFLIIIGMSVLPRTDSDN